MIRFLREKRYYLALLAFCLILPLLAPNRYIFQIIIMSTVFSIAALGMNLILGYTGQASLAHAGFFGIGAYGVGLLTKAGLSFWLAMPLSALAAAFTGFLIGLPTLRTRGSYFAISTLCFGVIVSIVAGSWIELTGGYSGLVGIPRPDPIVLPFGGRLGFESMTAQYYLVLFFLLLTLFVMHRLVYSLLGLSFMAVRNNEVLAEAVGINTFATKVVSFVVANFFAGLAGGIYASLIGSISPSTTSLNLTFNWLVFILLGGSATLAGPVIGSFAIPVLMEYLQFFSEYRLIIFGVLLIVVIIYFPRGLVGGLENLRKKVEEMYQKRKAGAGGAIEGGKPDKAV